MPANWTLVVLTYQCECGNSWTHQRLGAPTIASCRHKMWWAQDQPELDAEYPTKDSITHLTTRTKKVPFCFRCLDLSALADGDPPQINVGPASNRTRAQQEAPPNIFKLLLGD